MSKQFGAVVLARARYQGVLTTFFVGIILILVAVFFFQTTTKKAQAQGVLIPSTGIVRLFSTQPGTVISRHATEGQRVTAGDVLFVLNTDRSSSTDVATQRAISSLLNSRYQSYGAEIEQSNVQTKQKIDVAGQRAKNFEVEIGKIQAQIELQRQRVTLAEKSYARYGDLLATSFISTAQLQEKQSELLEQQVRLADMQRALASSERDLTNAKADEQSVRTQALREAEVLKREAASIRQDLAESESRREIVIRAPRNGVLMGVTAEPGQMIPITQALALLLPENAELEAEVYVPSRSVGFVKPGMDVMLRYQAFPYQKFGQHISRVREVAQSSIRPEDLTFPGVALPAGASAEPIYRIRLSLEAQSVSAYGRAEPLKPGMLVDASIILEKRKLYEWVLEPLFSLTGKI